MDSFIFTFVFSFGLSPVFSLSAYRYEFLDSVDGLYGNPTDDGQNASGMVGMVMRGVGNACMYREKKNNVYSSSSSSFRLVMFYLSNFTNFMQCHIKKYFCRYKIINC